MNPRDDFALFGWQGVELEVPRRWEMCAYDGDRHAGTVRLDDGLDERLTICWQQAKGQPLAQSEFMAGYERSLRKKHGPEASVTVWKGAALGSSDAFAFAASAKGKTLGMFRRCDPCGRTVLAEVHFPGGQADKALASRVLTSLTDHRNDGRTRWSVYGFSYEAPDEFALVKPGLTPGRLCFTHAGPRRGKLQVERWALGAEWLKRIALEAWPGEAIKAAGLRPRGEAQVEPCEVNQHAGCHFSASLPGRTWFHRDTLQGSVWFCPQDDKIFIVMGRNVEVEVLAEVAVSVECA